MGVQETKVAPTTVTSIQSIVKYKHLLIQASLIQASLNTKYCKIQASFKFIQDGLVSWNPSEYI